MRYDEATTRRDHALIRMTRKAFGDAVTLYADANGSYDVPKAVEIGRAMQDHGFRFYEEPVPFDYYQETREVAEALAIPIAGGEEEASLRQFRWTIETGVLQVVQPDLFYFGGMTRALRVARMAEAAGLECTPHMSGSGLGFLLHGPLRVVRAGPWGAPGVQGHRRTPGVLTHLATPRGEGRRARAHRPWPRRRLRPRLPPRGARRRGVGGRQRQVSAGRRVADQAQCDVAFVRRAGDLQPVPRVRERAGLPHLSRPRVDPLLAPRPGRHVERQGGLPVAPQVDANGRVRADRAWKCSW